MLVADRPVLSEPLAFVDWGRSGPDAPPPSALADLRAVLDEVEAALTGMLDEPGLADERGFFFATRLWVRLHLRRADVALGRE